MTKEFDEKYWSSRYLNEETGWDIGEVSTPLKNYFDQLEDKNIRILIPGAGNSYEAEYLFENGFPNVYICDIAAEPLKNFRNRVPSFPPAQVIQQDFFKIDAEPFDLIIEQTFFCAINPSMRKRYFEKAYNLLKKDGKIVGVLFNEPLNQDHPPFGGNKLEYYSYFKGYFDIMIFETCYQSILPRAGRELFINLRKK